MRVSLVALPALVLSAAASIGCTETPSSFPPCIDPYTPCVYDAGSDADAVAPDAGADAADATVLASDASEASREQ